MTALHIAGKRDITSISGLGPLQTPKPLGSAMPLSSYSINKYGAPGLGDLKVCGAPEIDEPQAYFRDVLLNSIFYIGFADRIQQLVFMFCRRTEDSVREYRRGRDLLALFVSGLPTRTDILVALEAVTHFEQCIAALSQAMALLEHAPLLGRPQRQRINRPDLQSRIVAIWNRTKHFEEDLINDTLHIHEITAPVWLTDTAICCRKAQVTFEELHGALCDLVEIERNLADKLVEQAVEARGQ